MYLCSPLSMKIAITGISGHVGNNVGRALLQNGYSINALVQNPQASSIQDLESNYIVGDLFSREALDKLCKDADVFIHIAGKVSIYPSERDLIYKTNIEGVKEVINACKRNGIKKIIHFSSIHAHISHGISIPINESTEYVQSEEVAYDYSKSKGEQLMLKAREDGLDVSIVNPTAIIGPRDYQPSLSGQMIMDIYNGSLPSLVKGGFDWVDVRDIAVAVVSIIEKNVSNQKFILSGHYAELKQIANVICNEKGEKYKGLVSPISLAKFGLPFISVFAKLTGKKALYTKESLKTIKEASFYNEHNSASKLLDYSPRPINKTIHDTAEWFKANSYL